MMVLMATSGGRTRTYNLLPTYREDDEVLPTRTVRSMVQIEHRPEQVTTIHTCWMLLTLIVPQR